MGMTEEYIYEKLAPDEVLIIAKVERTIIYATNRNGGSLTFSLFLWRKRRSNDTSLLLISVLAS